MNGAAYARLGPVMQSRDVRGEIEGGLLPAVVFWMATRVGLAGMISTALAN